jgi:hypothetical protein
MRLLPRLRRYRASDLASFDLSSRLARTLARSAHLREQDLSTEGDCAPQKPLSDAPPASAIAATAPRAARTRMRRSFIGRSSANLRLPALEGLFRCHARTSSRPPCPEEHENRPDSKVGRLHYSLRLHPKCPIQVAASAHSERFLDAPYFRTGAARTIGGALRTGQYVTLPMPIK